MLTIMNPADLIAAAERAEAFAYNARLAAQSPGIGSICMTEQFVKPRMKELKAALQVLTAKKPKK